METQCVIRPSRMRGGRSTKHLLGKPKSSILGIVKVDDYVVLWRDFSKVVVLC